MTHLPRGAAYRTERSTPCLQPRGVLYGVHESISKPVHRTRTERSRRRAATNAAWYAVAKNAGCWAVGAHGVHSLSYSQIFFTFWTCFEPESATSLWPHVPDSPFFFMQLRDYLHRSLADPVRAPCLSMVRRRQLVCPGEHRPVSLLTSWLGDHGTADKLSRAY